MYTPLYHEHLRLNAQMVEFAGYWMPLSYGPIKDEIVATRTDCAKFDVSHMGEFILKGDKAHQAVDFCITNDFLSAQPGHGVYGFLCQEDGCIIDDLICYKLDAQTALLCVNASNIIPDRNHIQQILKNHFPEVEFIDASKEMALIAFQGPKAIEKLPAYLQTPALIEAPNFSISEIQNEHTNHTPVWIAKTGYTGEAGVEIFSNNTLAPKIWNDLQAPCAGLAARDTLRVEAGLPLYGHEMSLTDQTTPLDLNLRFAVKLNKTSFVGLSALKSQLHPKSVMVNLAMSQQVGAIPRSGYPILDQSGTKVGVVTSGTFSPTLQRGLAIARLNYPLNDNASFFIEIRKVQHPTIVCKRSFLKQRF